MKTRRGWGPPGDHWGKRKKSRGQDKVKTKMKRSTPDLRELNTLSKNRRVEVTTLDGEIQRPERTYEGHKSSTASQKEKRSRRRFKEESRNLDFFKGAMGVQEGTNQRGGGNHKKYEKVTTEKTGLLQKKKRVGKRGGFKDPNEERGEKRCWCPLVRREVEGEDI